jgi:hypothetical protein
VRPWSKGRAIIGCADRTCRTTCPQGRPWTTVVKARLPRRATIPRWAAISRRATICRSLASRVGILGIDTAVVRRAGKHPSSARAWRFPATFAAVAVTTAWTIVAEFVAMPGTTRTARSARPARPASAARSSPSSGPATAAIAPWAATVAPTLAATAIPVARIKGTLLHVLRPRRQIDEVEELAALLGACRGSLALDHAHQTNLGHAPAHDVERLHQARKPVPLNLESGTHGFRLRPGTQVGRRLGRSISRNFGRNTFACAVFAFARRRRLTACSRPFRVFLGSASLDRDRLWDGRSLVHQHAFFDGRCRWGLLGRRSGNLRVLCPVGPLGLCRPLQQDSGELGDGLHGLRPS